MDKIMQQWCWREMGSNESTWSGRLMILEYSALPVVTAASEVTWSNWNQAELWCGLAKGLIWPLFWRLQAHSTAEFRVHISPAHWWCEKAPILSLQLWTLKASKMSGEGFIILWRLELQRTLGENTLAWVGIQATLFFLPQKLVRPCTGRTIATGPVRTCMLSTWSRHSLVDVVYAESYISLTFQAACMIFISNISKDGTFTEVVLVGESQVTDPNTLYCNLC